MKTNASLLPLILTLAGPICALAHDSGAAHGDPSFSARNFSAQLPMEMLEILRDGKGIPSADSDAIKALTARYLSRRSNRPANAISAPSAITRRQPQRPAAASAEPVWQFVTTPFNPLDAFADVPFTLTSYTAPTGNGALMAASFTPFRPKVRFYWDGTTFYEESDNTPDPAMMPNLMVGITSWQQQVPIPASYFAGTTNPENSTSSLGFGQPNYWRLPLVPVPAASPIPISAGNFQRGAVALAANGIAIFNPKNNTGAVSYQIGELDAYGGHCGLADDYHYHIIPTHLLSAFGGVLSNDKPVAWALDGYPIYGYVEPDGTARQALDADGGHDIGSGLGYHYHAIGTTTVDATHPYGTPQSPYLMSNFHGTVVNFGGQVDGQPEVGPIRASGTGGYTAQPVSGASIVAFKNPVALTTDGSGNLIENVGGIASPDSYLMRVSISGTTYDECWKINRSVNPRTLTVTWRLAAATTTTTYTPNATGNRLTAYPMAAWSETKLPDTGQTLNVPTAPFGQDSDYTINPQSFTDNNPGNPIGTITDNVTGLIWQKTDNGESTWENAVANAASITTGGFTDWRLPTPAEALSIINHNNSNPALNTTYFPSNGAGAADYWWTSDIYGTSTTNVWCTNAGGGVGPKPKAETISAGGVLRYSARYVRGKKGTNAHNYLNNLDSTITDTDTGLMWTQLPAAAMNWNSALSYAENLALGGYTDWRLPNAKELATLTDYTLANAASTTGIKPSINRTMFAKTLTSCATTSGSTTVTCADTTGMLVGMPIVDQSDIAGAYISNTTAPTVTVITNSTTFTISAAATGTGSGLTFKALVPPTAYWSSSVQKAGTLTSAWLVEFGINSTVPAASGPTRNTQGIISYEIFASTYPVFAVRTASVTTQIAVSQGGTALTDAVSTVAYGNVNVGSTLSKTFTISNTGVSALTISGVTIDGTNASNFTVTTAPATTIAAGGSTTMDVLFNASTSGNKVAAIHIASSDTSVGAAFDIALSGTGYVPPPTITAITNQTTMRNNATSTLAFTVGDPQTAAASLTVSATSSNTTLVSVANIVFGGSGASRTVTVTPASGQTGTVTITVTVSNGSSTTSTTFTLTVSPPNILIIIADDYGLDASSLYSSLLGNSGTATFPPTPNIASLAANGVQFNHAYTYTVCSPTRSAILTGRYGFRTGTANVVGGGASNNSLQASEFTLPKAFAANSSLGYQLKQFGKWHLGGGNTAPGAIGGWPSFAGSLAGEVADYYSWSKVVTDGTAGGTTTSTSTTYATTDVVNDAVSFISTQTTAAKPWVAWVAFNAPHTTTNTPLYHLPAKSLRPSSTYDLLPNTPADIAANPLNYYNAMIEAMDTEIGRLLASVDLSKTDVIFIGDNGTSPLTLQAPYPTNRGKASLYEGGIRVPLIIRGFDVVAPGRTSDVLTHFVDLYSTILELAGINVATTVPTGTTLDSQSLLPVLQNQSVTRSLVFGDYYDFGFPSLSGSGRVLRNLQYKLIRFQTGTDQFYDLLADPYEGTNLLAGGVAAMTTARQTAYNSLVTQLANYNTAPTIGTIANQSTATGTATSALALTVGDAELSPTILAVSGSSSNTTLVPTANVVIGGSGASRTVTVTPATGLTGTSTITTSVTDGTFTTSTSFVLTVSASVGPPTITAIATSPAAPSNTDTVAVTANVQPSAGRTLSSVQLTYSTGAATTGTVWSETMATSADLPWVGANCVNAWTVVANGGAGNFRQLTGANHGTGNVYGLDVSKGTANATDSMFTTTNAINATGTSGYIEFWVFTASLVSGGNNGWTFQTSPDGTTWTTRLSELTSTSHAYQLYHYDFAASERVSTLKIRFQFVGNAAANPPPKAQFDDMKIVTTTGAASVSVAMFDDGLHGDGAAGDGVFGVSIPAQTAGTTVSYTITATDSAAGSTTSSSNSYTVATAAPVLAVTPATTLSSAGAAGSGSFSPASIAYTLTNSGTGTMSWTAAKTANWLSLSSASGTLAAGASTTVTVSINTANANSLAAATYNDTVTFTNGTNGSGNTTRAASLLITNGTPTAPSAPVIATLPLFSAGTSKAVTWPAVANATSYTLQIASSANFTANLLTSQTVGSASATFTNLADGVAYYYRVLATNSIGSSAYSNTVYSTQDTGMPTVAITAPTVATTTATNTITVTGTSSDTRSGISGVKVNNVAATSGNSFATWSATIPLGFGGNAITATAFDGAGNQTTSSAVVVTMTTFQTYNPLIIPDTITGTTMNLDLYQTNKRFPVYSTSGTQTLGINPSTTLGPAPGTTTLGYNGALMWGPTLIMNKGDTVQLNVTNHLDQSVSTLLRSTTTTVHWHGFHIPAIMDGGPRQVIAGGATWSPIFTVKNDAATYWYHPHLHMATQEQLTLGAGGMIIVRDPVEAALGLPRTYGVDDIPLAVTTRRLLSGNNEFSSNQYVQSDGSTSSSDNYGDYVLVNGTMNPQVSLPKQFVRLRILCADIQRGYRFGFSDNRNFYVIANDQGLLNAPLLVSQLTMMIGERVEILVDLSNDTIGSSLDLMAYDNLGTAGGPTGAQFGFAGSESGTRAPNGNVGNENGGLLCNSDFKVLHINVAAATANPITSVPATLANNTYWTNADVTNTRTVNIQNGNAGTPGFTFDGIAYSPTTNNFNIPLNAIEKWNITGGTIFGHSIHIHDIKFKIVSRSVTQGGANTNQIFDTISNVASLIGTKASANYESGWKDTLYVPRNETVSVIAKYDDFASPNNPYMLHCHMLNHEDGGLMGQFVVTSAATETLAIASFTRTGSSNVINFQFNGTTGTSYLVQYSPDMTTGSWVTIGTVTNDGTSAAFTEADGTRLAQARGFYRAVIQSVLTPPVITSGATATATRGAAFSYQIAATNSPTGYGAILLSGNTALPGGLSVNGTTGMVSGTVPATTAAGTYNISVSASNSGGTVHKTVVLTVQ